MPDAIAHADGAVIETHAEYDHLLARIEAADGAALSVLGQAAAIEHFERRSITYEQLFELHDAWMRRLRLLVGPETREAT